jgi:nucleoside-diphosphate-sugar epimerase
MKILIIGGTGLISTALTRQLAAMGHAVAVFNRGQRDVGLPEGVTSLTGDRYDPGRFVDSMQSAGAFDCVIDMITYKPEDANSLLRAFAGRTGHLIVSSTIDVYAKPAVRYPIAEDAPQQGIGDYARNKVLCEQILMRDYETRGTPVTIIRPAHTYGKGGLHRGHVIHSFGRGTGFLDRLRKGKPVIVHGDGSSLWTSCHLEDVARGFAAAVGNAAAIGKTYHVTADEWLTWDRYHQLVAEAMGAPKPELIHIPTDVLAAMAPKHSVLALENFQFNNIFDNSAAKRDLGFRYTIGFLEGMRDTVPWVESTYGFDNSDDDPYYDEVIRQWRRATSGLAASPAPREA